MTRWQANAVLVLVAAIWGSAFVAQNRAMEHMGPMAFTGLRFLLGALVAAAFASPTLAARTSPSPRGASASPSPRSNRTPALPI